MNPRIAFAATLVIMSGSMIFPGFISAGQRTQSGPIVVYESYHDTSQPAREYSMEVPQGNRGTRVEREHLRPGRILHGAGTPVVDLAEQSSFGPEVSAAIQLNFDGIPNSANGQSLEGVPPDENLAVGTTQVVQLINTAWQVFDKSTGKSVFGPQQISALFTGLPGLCGQGIHSFNYSDPIVFHDQLADRWLVSIIGLTSTGSEGNECIAVSQTSDATGKYSRYVFKFGTGVLNDYPKLAVWPDAYYASYNLFTANSVSADACAYDSAAMQAGQKAKAVCFQNGNEFSYLPATLDGSTPPPTGEPDSFVDLSTGTSLHLFRFHVDFQSPSQSKFSGPFNIVVNAYNQACNGGTCIPQPKVTQKIDSLGDRLMFRLAYRNFGDHETLVASHSVQTSKAASGERWYEIRDPNGTPTVFQQGTFTHGSNSLWMGSIAMDKAGDMALGFSESNGTNLFPTIVFTGRVPSDHKGMMESPKTIFSGKGSQTQTNRWGDYSSMVIDPSDDCTFWYTNQYMPKTENGIDFRTRIASLKFPSCK